MNNIKDFQYDINDLTLIKYRICTSCLLTPHIHQLCVNRERVRRVDKGTHTQTSRHRPMCDYKRAEEQNCLQTGLEICTSGVNQQATADGWLHNI